MYMGELIRQVLVDLMKDDLIFIGVDRERLLERGSFFTRYASEIESDPVGDYTRCRQALEEIGVDPEEVTDDDCSALRYVRAHHYFLHSLLSTSRQMQGILRGIFCKKNQIILRKRFPLLCKTPRGMC